MSTLPVIDELKVHRREIEKLRQQLLASFTRESHLEILAEALRDERDEALKQISELKDKTAKEK